MKIVLQFVVQFMIILQQLKPEELYKFAKKAKKEKQ